MVAGLTQIINLELYQRKKMAILKLKTIHSIITSEIFIPSNTQGVLGTKKDKFIVHIHDKTSQQSGHVRLL